MTWSYTASPTDTPVDAVRFMVGDTNATDPLIQDEEIEWLLILFPADTAKPPWLAAASACDTIAARLARQTQISLGDISQEQQQQYDHYIALAAQFRADFLSNGEGLQGALAIRPAVPILGGGGPSFLGGPAPYFGLDGIR